MKRITASFTCLLTVGLITVAVVRAGEDPVSKPVAVPPPPPTASAVTATDATNKAFLLIRKRATIQKEISALESRIRNNPGSAELRQEIMAIEAKITELQNLKRNLIMAAEPKLKELYRQLGDISCEIAQKPTAMPPAKP